MEQTLEQKLSELEALLFVQGEPLPLKKIEALMSLSREEAEAVLGAFARRLEAEEHGLTLLRDGDRVQLVTKPRWGALLESFIKEELNEDLTPATLETLSLILYLGPIERSRIEYFRGVNSLFTLRTLRIRGLIDRLPDPQKPKFFLYAPSLALLRHLGITKQEELPEYGHFRTLLEQSESAKERGEESHSPEVLPYHAGDSV